VQRVELVVGGVGERGSDVVAEADVASRGFGVSGALGGAALAVVFGGVAQLLVAEAGAREEASSRARVVSASASLLAAVSRMKTGMTQVLEPFPGRETDRGLRRGAAPAGTGSRELDREPHVTEHDARPLPNAAGLCRR